jgi:hypothetical protein
MIHEKYQATFVPSHETVRIVGVRNVSVAFASGYCRAHEHIRQAFARI